MLKYTLSVAAAVGLLASAAMAQAPAAKEPGSERGGLLRQACQADIAKLCGGIEAGRGKRFACLTEKKDQLSAECRTAVEQRGDNPRKSDEKRGGAKQAADETGDGRKGRGKGNGRMAACRTDAATFCQNIEKGKGQRVACLQQNAEKLQPACREALALRKQPEKETP